jgi:hypothetical protein
MRSFRVVAGETGFASQFTNLRHDARGGAFLLPHQQLGALALPTNPTNGQTLTLTINGNAIAITFVTAIGTTPGNILIAATAAATAANLLALLNQPQTTTANAVAFSATNQQLLSYASFSLVGTTITISSNNTSIYAPLSSVSASTTVTGASWTAQTMQLYVEPGVVYVNGTRVIFSGGSTPTVTAPSANPRIDVLTIDSSGVLAWTAGAESATPSAPSYPANKAPLCELYNVVAETALYDFENQQTGQGYVSTDVRSYLQYPFNPTSLATNLLPSTDATYNLGSPTYEWQNLYVKSGIYVNGLLLGGTKFGGTGSDGALSASSGTTTINLGNAAVVVKNYTSISLTGTANLVFTNPNVNGTIVIIKCQGNITLTSSATPIINASGIGAAGGTGGSATSSTTASGNAGNPGYGAFFVTNPGSGATASVGAGGLAPSAIQANILSQYLQKYPQAFVGAGGGGGNASSSSSGGSPVVGGTGGNGGGCLIIECAGAWNFTTTNGISVAGTTGGNGSGGAAFRGPGGGGGGGAGFCLALYGTLTANTGTTNVSGGTGGTNDPTTDGQTASGGGGGGSNVAGNAGTASATPNTITGGTGANGLAIVAANTEFT